MMKKTLLFSLALTFIPSMSYSAEKLSEAQQFGTMAGMAMACGGGKTLYMFEEIVSRYFANTTPNEVLERDRKDQFVRAKISAFRQQSKKKQDCGIVLDRFARMPMMQFQLFEDGTLKTPEGRYLLPRGQRAFNPKSPRIY